MFTSWIEGANADFPNIQFELVFSTYIYEL